MCVVSMIGDHYRDKWVDPDWYDPYGIRPIYVPPEPNSAGGDFTIEIFDKIKLEKQIEDLRKEVEELKKLLQRAKEYDEKTNQPHCEMEEKIALLKKMAELVGVDLQEVLKK